MSRRTYRVNELAQLSGVSIRTLHHYDAIGLLVPTARSESGYRLYDEASVFRLQQILIGRALGLSLDAICKSLDDPSFDRRAALREQRAALVCRAEETARMLRAVDRALEALDASEGGKEETMTAADLKEIFDGFDPSEYDDEARERWGHADAYAESARRTAAYTKADWQAMKDEQDAIYRDAASAMLAGTAPGDEAMLAIVERHRLLIDRWFYPCSVAMQKKLADMWESDPRFAANIDRYGANLTSYVVAAVRARG